MFSRLLFIVCVCAIKILQGSGRTTYMDFERPNLTYYNPKFYGYMNISALRRRRGDPIHYVSAHSECLVDFGNEILVDAYIFEFLSNEYRRSFIEVHYKLCDWMRTEKDFLPYMIKFMKIKTCPFPKGEYHFVDVSFPNIPLLKTFPFTKGRLFLNVSNWVSAERVFEAHVDLVIKEKK